MIFAPHTLTIRRSTELQRDEYGRPVPQTAESWIDVGRCRCDDNTTKEFTSDNGHVYRPAYHIVCDGIIDIKAGDVVRCLDVEGKVRGEGKAYIVKKMNYLHYTEIWV